MTHHLFVYASLLPQREMELHCRDARFVAIGWLADRRVAFTKRSTKWGGHSADVIAAPGRRVWGAVYAITDDHLAALDRREGAPVYYQRIAVDIAAADGAALAAGAWVYEVTAAHRGPEAAPGPRYWATILEGARERGLPASYVAELEATVRALGGGAP